MLDSIDEFCHSNVVHYQFKFYAAKKKKTTTKNSHDTCKISKRTNKLKRYRWRLYAATKTHSLNSCTPTMAFNGYKVIKVNLDCRTFVRKPVSLPKMDDFSLLPAAARIMYVSQNPNWLFINRKLDLNWHSQSENSNLGQISKCIIKQWKAGQLDFPCWTFGLWEQHRRAGSIAIFPTRDTTSTVLWQRWPLEMSHFGCVPRHTFEFCMWMQIGLLWKRIQLHKEWCSAACGGQSYWKSKQCRIRCSTAIVCGVERRTVLHGHQSAK